MEAGKQICVHLHVTRWISLNRSQCPTQRRLTLIRWTPAPGLVVFEFPCSSSLVPSPSVESLIPQLWNKAIRLGPWGSWPAHPAQKSCFIPARCCEMSEAAPEPSIQSPFSSPCLGTPLVLPPLALPAWEQVFSAFWFRRIWINPVSSAVKTTVTSSC